MKNLVIIVLVLLAIYWSGIHFEPLPLNHESLGLFNHNIHRAIGVVLFVVSAFLVWLWKIKKTNKDNDNR